MSTPIARTDNLLLCYHEVQRSDVESIMRTGLRLKDDGDKDTERITDVNRFIDTHRTPHYIEADVSRINAVYGYLPTDTGVISITTGEAVSLHQAISDYDSALLRLHVDPSRCYVSDLDLYDTIKDAIEQNDTERAIQLSRHYWDCVVVSTDFSLGDIARPELIITYPVAPEAIVNVITLDH